jgi:nucleoside-diphosphate-sugar epimerase
VPITEEHPRQAQSPYSATKIAADALAESFHRCFDLPTTIVRPFNTYGPRQSARAVIPTIIGQLLAGREEIQLGDLRPKRDLVFVKDTVRGFAEIAGCDSLIGRDCNIATGTDVSVGDLAQTLVDLINPQARIVQDPQRLRPANSEVFRLCGCRDRLAEATGWVPGHDLRRGLERTIEWFRDPANLRQYKTDIYNL